MTVGDRLKKARGERTQAEVAETIGVSQATIAHWESGDVSPRTHRIKQLAKYFKLKVTDLLPNIET
jgi:HTH-type transcriptional regulator, competence development regulator